MLRALAIAGALALLLPTLVAAQDHDHRGPPGKGAPAKSGGAPPSKSFVPHGPAPGGAGPKFKPGPGPGPGGGGPKFKPGLGFHPPGPPGPGGLHPGFGGPGGPHGQFGYHGHFFNPIRISPFLYPPGWAYRPWAVGAILPPIFLAPQYYYPDWASLGLDPPPPGTQWVRYGPDLLLVDVNTGQVLESVPGVFYE